MCQCSGYNMCSPYGMFYHLSVNKIDSSQWRVTCTHGVSFSNFQSSWVVGGIWHEIFNNLSKTSRRRQKFKSLQKASTLHVSFTSHDHKFSVAAEDIPLPDSYNFAPNTCTSHEVHYQPPLRRCDHRCLPRWCYHRWQRLEAGPPCSSDGDGCLNCFW